MIRAFGPLVITLIACAATAAEDPVPLDDHAALEAWMDGMVTAQLDAYDVAGATVAVVKGGQTILLKGYGYADADARKPVDPNATLFRIASVSKLFVWLSVMQLVDQGKIDLNADVNSYLSDVNVPERFGSHVTMKHLLTHTAGFEDQVIGLFARDASAMRPLGEVLRDELPARVRQPGNIASYSNHGTGLAMHVVEQITGQDWQTYIQSNILDPLGMSATVLAQPIPADREADLSKGYVFEGQRFVDKPFEFVPLGPVGGISTTAADAAKFMTMFLHKGELNGARVLGEAAADTMQSELHRMARTMNPMDHGIIDSSQHGVRIVGHDGDTIYFHTLFALFPEHDAGLFISYNSSRGGEARAVLLDRFVRRFFSPGEPEKPVPLDGFEDRAARYTGAYRVNRYSHKSFAKLGAAFTPVNVSYDGNGALKVSMLGNRRWIEVEPNTFQDEHSDDRLVFIEDGKGKITHFGFAAAPIFAFERIGPLGTPELHMILLAFTVVSCAVAVIAWPLAAFIRWRHGVIVSRQHVIPRAARALGWVTTAVVLVFLVMFLGGVQDPNEVAFGMPAGFEILLSLPLAIALLALIMALTCFHLWSQRRGRFVWRVVYTILTLALLISAWQAFYWNLTILQNLRFL